MYLSKRQNGIYYVYYNQQNGKRTCISSGTKLKAEAIKFLSQFKEELEKRRIEKLTAISLSDYIQRFLSFSQANHTPKTAKGYKLTLGYLQSFFEDAALKEITYSKLNEYFEERITSSSIYQARKDLICFNSFFNRAMAEGYLLSNPCKEIKRFKIPQKQPLFFSELDFDLLISKIDDKDIRDLVLFAIQAGLRQMELITLEWNQINFKERFLILDNRGHLTKSKKIRTVPLSIKAMQILTARQLTSKTNLIFTDKGKQFNANYLSNRFKNCVRKAKLNDKLNFHSLRHSFASWLVQRGVSIFQVSKLLGHSRVETTEIYSHLRAEDLRSAINTLNN